MSLPNIGRNALGDPLRRLMERVLRQMRVARRRLDIVVTEQLADHRQAVAPGESPRGEGMPNNLGEFEDGGKWRRVTRHVASGYRSNAVTI